MDVLIGEIIAGLYYTHLLYRFDNNGSTKDHLNASCTLVHALLLLLQIPPMLLLPQVPLTLIQTQHIHSVRPLSLDLLSKPPRQRILILLQHSLRRRPSQQRLKRIPRIQQIQPPPILRLQAPLRRLKKPLTRGSITREPHRPRSLAPAHGKPNVNPPVQLVHLAVDPGDLVLEVDLVAEQLAGLGGGAQGVERAGDDGRGHLLVVEDGDAAGCDDGEEEGEGAAPAELDLADVYKSCTLA